MNVVVLISRCLSILSIVGLLAVPTIGSAAVPMGAVLRAQMPDVASSSMTDMVMPVGEMDCQSTGSHPSPDCDHGCPWAMLCMAAFIQPGPAFEFGSAVSVAMLPARPVNDRDGDRQADGPPARPPKP